MIIVTVIHDYSSSPNLTVIVWWWSSHRPWSPPQVVTDLISDFLCESIGGVTEDINVAFLGTIDAWASKRCEWTGRRLNATERDAKWWKGQPGDWTILIGIRVMTYLMSCVLHTFSLHHCAVCGMVASVNLGLRLAEAKSPVFPSKSPVIHSGWSSRSTKFWV